MSSRRINAENIIRRGNIVFVLIFAIIAISGIILMFSHPPGGVEKALPLEDSLRVEQKQVEVKESFSIYYFLLKTILFTAMIVILIFIISKVLKTRASKSLTFGRDIKIVGRKYLSPKQYLLLIELCGKRLLLGVTENSITKLSSFEIEDSYEKESAGISDYEEGENGIVGKFRLKKKK